MVWRTDRPGGERAHGPKQAMTGEKSPAVHKNVGGDPMTTVLTRARRLPGRFRSPDHKRCADPYRRRSWMQRHDAVLRKSGRLSALGQAGRGTRAIRSPDRAVRSSDTPDPPVAPTDCLTATYAGQESNCAPPVRLSTPSLATGFAWKAKCPDPLGWRNDWRDACGRRGCEQPGRLVLLFRVVPGPWVGSRWRLGLARVPRCATRISRPA